MSNYSKEELEVLNKIASDWFGSDCDYEYLEAEDPEKADEVYCYATDNGLFGF